MIMIFHGEINLPDLINNEFSLQFTARPPGSIKINLNLTGDDTRDDWQLQFLAQNRTILQLFETTSQQCCNAVTDAVLR